MPALLLFQVPRPECHIDIAVFQITIDAILLHALGNDSVPAIAQLEYRVGVGVTPAFFQAGLAGQTADHLPSTATGGTPADLILLQHRNTVTALREGQSGSDSSKPRANHTDISANISA